MLRSITRLSQRPVGLLRPCVASYSNAYDPLTPPSKVFSPKEGELTPEQKADLAEQSIGHDAPDHHMEHAMRDRSEGDVSNRTFVYMMTGAAKGVYASLARLAVLKVVGSMAASADVMAMASLEVDIGKVDVGNTMCVKWRGKPVFIRHRNDKEISAAVADDGSDMRDPQKDSDRVTSPEWVVVMGVCTHLGCVPIPNAGEWNGWFCPCHGSHYDTSGRIRKGPAPLNLEVPPHVFLSDTLVKIG